MRVTQITLTLVASIVAINGLSERAKGMWKERNFVDPKSDRANVLYNELGIQSPPPPPPRRLIWRKFTTKHNQTWYYNTRTMTWEPKNFQPPTTGFIPFIDTWVPFKDQQGRICYWNSQTNKSTYKTPDSVAKQARNSTRQFSNPNPKFRIGDKVFYVINRSGLGQSIRMGSIGNILDDDTYRVNHGNGRSEEVKEVYLRSEYKEAQALLAQSNKLVPGKKVFWKQFTLRGVHQIMEGEIVNQINNSTGTLYSVKCGGQTEKIYKHLLATNRAAVEAIKMAYMSRYVQRRLHLAKDYLAENKDVTDDELRKHCDDMIDAHEKAFSYHA